jgi:hypothetical protein
MPWWAVMAAQSAASHHEAPFCIAVDRINSDIVPIDFEFVGQDTGERRAAPRLDAQELGLQVAILLPHRRPGALHQRGLEPGGALAQAIGSALAGALVVAQHSLPGGSRGLTVAMCRFCCKSLFALVIKISFGCTREFRVKMWGTSSPEDKLAGDLGNVIEATSTGGRRSDFFTAEKLAPGNLGLLQQLSATTRLLQCVTVDLCLETPGRVCGCVAPNPDRGLQPPRRKGGH